MYGVDDDSHHAASEEFRTLMDQNNVLMRENRILTLWRDQLAEEKRSREVDASQQVAPRRASRMRFNSSSSAEVRRSGQVRLNVQQKAHVVAMVYSSLEHELAQLVAASQRSLAELDAMLEETKIRIHELKKESYEFRREIVKGAVNTRTKKIMAERVVKYFEEKLRHKEQIIEKTRMKNTALKAQISVLDQQLKAKEAQGESLSKIDFYQLKIQNQQFQAKIKERNAQLLELKMTTGKTVQKLNNAKRRLANFMLESTQLRTSLSEREETLMRLTEELTRVEDETARERKRQARYRATPTNADGMPQVLDYVAMKSRQRVLDKEILNWERKVEIARMSASRRAE